MRQLLFLNFVIMSVVNVSLLYTNLNVIIPPANCVCGWLYPLQTVFVGGYTVFTLSVLPTVCVCVCVCPLRFVSLITLRIFDGISSNFANTFICTRQILIIKK